MTSTSGPADRKTPARIDIGDRALVRTLLIAAAILVAYYAVWSWLPPVWHAPGSPVLQSFAIAGSILLLMPLAFVVAKRGGKSSAPTH